MGWRMAERKLAAILKGDVAGYSRLMAEDDIGTVRTLRARRGVRGDNHVYGEPQLTSGRGAGDVAQTATGRRAGPGEKPWTST